MRVDPLTLHIRLTKSCNADCSYCSSWQAAPAARLSPKRLEKAIAFILDTSASALGVSFTHVTAQFLGGEIAMVPATELEEHIRIVEELCAARGMECTVGAQSNLIVSERRAAQLYDQFSGRLGTSIDLTSDAKTVKGDAGKYRLIWKQADHYLQKKRSTPGAIFVVEPGGDSSAKTHLREAVRSRRAITFRPVFRGGIDAVQLNSADQFQASMVSLFDEWFLRLPVIAEPFFQLCQARLAEMASLGGALTTACAFQSDCTRKSVNIEPNGDLYVCLEMADAGLTPIGNALHERWDHEAISGYASRAKSLPTSCRQCPYLKSCHGGCMYESIAQGNGVHGKSYHCSTWKVLFGRIDAAIEAYGAEHIREWLERIAVRHENARSDGLAKAAESDMVRCE